MPRPTLTSVVSAVAVGSLAILSLSPMAATAAPAAADLIISEYVEGSGTNKALELYNGTDADVDLSGYSIEVYPNGRTSRSLNASLRGTLRPGDTFVFADSALEAYADQTTRAGLWNGDDAIVLSGPDGVVDSFGEVGFDPGSEWSSGGVSTQNHTLRRLPGVCVGDTDPRDDFDPSAQWEQFDQDTFAGLGAHSTACTGEEPRKARINEFSASTTGPDVEYIEVYGGGDTDYSDLAVIAVEGDVESPSAGSIVSVSEVGSTGPTGYWLDELASDTLEDGSMSILLVSGYDNQVVVDGDGDGELDNDTGLTVVDAVALLDGGAGDLSYAETVLTAGYDGNDATPGGASRIPDGTDTDTSADWVRNDFDLAGIPGQTGSLTAGEALNTPGASNSVGEPGDPTVGRCADPASLIGAVQGDGDTSPALGERVQVEGIVVGDFQSGGFDGVYLQDAGDADSATSDGIFVYAPTAVDVDSGDYLRVSGTVEESFGMTRLAEVEIRVCGDDEVLPAAVQVQLPQDDAEYEATEGMRVTLPQSLAILEYFNFGRSGEISLGVDRQFQPTAVFEPGSPQAAQLLDDNEGQRITLDDGRSESNPDPARHPNGDAFELGNTFRGGDQVSDATGVLDYRFEQWRVQPTQAATYESVNPRPDVPEVGGSMTVASFNVLNYFTTLGERGADNAEEFDRQEAKIVAALSRLDADIVGLIEIENNGTALDTLVAALNDEAGAGTYAALTTGVIGADDVTTALIYQPDKVSLDGDFATLTSADDPRFLDSKNRPALAQTFTETASDESVTVVVNHLKSKGSSCEDVGDPTDPKGQGNCNGVRTDAARALADWAGADPTGSGESDVVVIGDLNSYDKEDPITALGDAGFVDLLGAEQGELAYSYVFDGQLGYLDYALANGVGAGQVSGAAVWQINADEASLLDYDTEFKKDAQDAIYAPDPYRSSDHDPVLIGLDLADQSTVSVQRLSGPDRYDTAVRVAQEVDPSDVVYVASGQVFPDALTATPLAIRKSAPLVLTRSNSLPATTADYLADLAPADVVVLGGSGRISNTVLTQIEAASGAQVSRIEGPNRYATAAQVAADWAPGEPDTVWLASGTMFADALSVGPLAGIEDEPVLLTDERVLSAQTAAALDRLDPERIVILGGPGRISDTVFTQAEQYASRVERLYGIDRYETAASIADQIEPSDEAFLATGENFPDALGGGVLAGLRNSPLLLTAPGELGEWPAASLEQRAPTVVTALGGPGAVEPPVLDAVRALLSP